MALTTALLFLTLMQADPLATKDVTPALDPVSFERVELGSGFWERRLKVVRGVTVPLVLERCFETGRVENLAIAGGLAEGEFVGRLYDDSDVYKALEGVARVLHLERGVGESGEGSAATIALKARAQEVIDAIAAAQCADGYLSSYYQLVHGADEDVSQRWTNVAHGHELYCIGHLIEAGVAWKRATGESQLLDVGVRAADHVASVFLGVGARTEAPGHQELELALYLLAEETGEVRFAELATDLLERRGRTEWNGAAREPFGEYTQDHVPIRELSEPVGHAVRLMYQLCAMTDLVRTTGDREVLAALERTWQSIVDGHLYVTGGIGAMASNEGFGAPGDLPDLTAYNETCAGIGMVLWNHRMGLLTGEAKYFDLVERALHNNVLAGLSLDGTRFFYVNPLASAGGHHRVPWFDCSCCPTNLARVLPSVGGLVFAEAADGVNVLQEIPASATLRVGEATVELTQSGGVLGGDGPRTIEALVEGELSAEAPVVLRVRMPGIEVGEPLSLLDPDGETAWLESTGSWEDLPRIEDFYTEGFDMEAARASDDPWAAVGEYLDATKLRDAAFEAWLASTPVRRSYWVELRLDRPGSWTVVFARDATRVHTPEHLSPEVGYSDPWSHAQAASRPNHAVATFGPFVLALEAADHGGQTVDLFPTQGGRAGAWTEPWILRTEGDAQAAGIATWLAELELEPVQAEGLRLVDSRPLRAVGQDPHEPAAYRVRPALLQFVPYFAWDNREAGEMVVWIPTDAEHAEVPGEAFAATGDGLRLVASHCYASDSVASIVDELEPRASNDASLPRHTFWDHRGTEEWLRIELGEPRELSAVEVYWFDDTGHGSCRVPASWRLEQRVGEAWQPLATDETPGVALDRWNVVTFEPRTTAALRLVVQLRDGVSGGLLGLRIR